jgi:transposase-like protein
MASKRRSSYRNEQKQAVLAAVRAKGVCAAAMAHGVPQSCVSRWASAAGVRRDGNEPTPIARELAVVPVARRARVARSYTPSQKAEVLEHAGAHGVTAAAEKFGISRFSIYDWRRKTAKAAKGEGPSPTRPM